MTRRNRTKKEQTLLLESLKTADGVVKAYFTLITKKDLDSLLELFDDEAVIYEPFSNVEDGLQGKTAIENFLKVAFMANAGLHRETEFERITDDEAIALITFERGGFVKARFSFRLVKEEEDYISNKMATARTAPMAAAAGQKKRIKELKIQFL